MILVTGASGFVGNAILRNCQGVIPCPSLKNASEDQVRRIILESGADTIIHTAAISDIGECAKNPDLAYEANVNLPIYLAKCSKDIKLVCFSSDQVYSGSYEECPYTEDMAKPENLYSQYKLEMENRVLDINPDAVMLRAEWMYDFISNKSNYFLNILNACDSVSVSSNQYRGVTYVKEVAENIKKACLLPGGAYNFGSETKKSILEITEEFLTYMGKKIKIQKTGKSHNLWMNCQKARAFGVDFSTVEDGLKKCLDDYRDYLSCCHG